MDTFSHRISYLLSAGLPLDEVYAKYIEDRYKRTMLGLSREKREEVCAHPDKYYPEFRKRWDEDWQKKVSEVEKLQKEVAFTLRTPDKETIEAITQQVIAAHKGGPLSPTAKIGPRSIYGVWERSD